jgi:RNA polymerase sigma factor (TIGR02999 family)
MTYADLPSRSRTTALLEQTEAGASPKLDQLVPLIFDELHEMAHRQLAREHHNVTLQTTALVHEAYLRLVDDARVTGRGRAYFFAAAARAMRQVLVDAARRRTAAKRGGGVPLTSLDGQEPSADVYASDLLDLDRALEELKLRNPRQVQVVECRFFAGLSVEETATALDVSPRTVKADWALARAWLYDVLRKDVGE